MAGKFALEDDAREFFRKLNQTSRTGKTKTLLQEYWLCALVGLAAGRPGSPDKSTEIVEYFVPPLDAHQHLIRAFLFWRYAEDRGYQATNEADILTGLLAFFDQDAPSKLKGIAIAELDKYAASGFERIQARIQNPVDLATFLVDYVALLSECAQASRPSTIPPASR